jgi:hypothetical protein
MLDYFNMQHALHSIVLAKTQSSLRKIYGICIDGICIAWRALRLGERINSLGQYQNS